MVDRSTFWVAPGECASASRPHRPGRFSSRLPVSAPDPASDGRSAMALDRVEAHRVDLGGSRGTVATGVPAFGDRLRLGVDRPVVWRQQVARTGAVPTLVAGARLGSGARLAHRDVVVGHQIRIVDAERLVGRVVADTGEPIVAGLLAEYLTVDS